MKTNKFFLFISVALLATMTVGCNFPTVEFPGASLSEEIVVSVPLREPTATPAPTPITVTPAPTATPTTTPVTIFTGLADPVNGSPLILQIREGDLFVGKLVGADVFWELVAQSAVSILYASTSWQEDFQGEDNGWFPLLIVAYIDDQGETTVVEFNTRYKFDR